jgi:arylsulfatase A-like enzyme
MARLAWIPVAALALSAPAAAADRPNVVVILADDLGYGDVGCYNPQRGKIPTPHIDALAAAGLRFSVEHSTGVCSPTRYSLLTVLYHLGRGSYRASSACGRLR